MYYRDSMGMKVQPSRAICLIAAACGGEGGSLHSWAHY